MKQRLLFVDDEPRVLQGLRRMLWPLRDEFEGEFVASGNDALAALGMSRFDVVVSDMRMPGMTGADLLARVRDLHPEVIRLVLSGEATEEASLHSVGPAHQFLSKPCDTEMLRSTIRRTIRTRQLLRSAPLRELVSQVGTLPSPPATYVRIVSELQAAEPSMQRVADIIASDPAMTAKVLQLLNSAFFGVQRHIADPHQATLLLGLKTVSVLVLSIGAFARFEHATPKELRLSALMPHSLRTAARARAIAARLSGDTGLVEDSATAGLLHDIGKLVIASKLPDAAREAVRRAADGPQVLADAERASLGATHAEIGGYLLGLWGLPDRVVEAVAFHHAPSAAPLPANVVLTAVHASDVLEHERHPELLIGKCPSLDEAYLAQQRLAGEIDGWRALEPA